MVLYWSEGWEGSDIHREKRQALSMANPRADRKNYRLNLECKRSAHFDSTYTKIGMRKKQNWGEQVAEGLG